ncbi:ankyrin repeat-containing domain protein [Mycena belliarum]|uniref:Ankyrin repeat-containing domain protein n=1 Tax=Mycena belliarum TaxID=1033014 RepID=A0AAD6XKJ9_9AGAR|nr:ankyrin repeat-containing domain protein [Mycena belliae]
MAEILGTVVTILQLVDTALKAREYIKDFQNASAEQRKLFSDIEDLRLLLTELEKRAKASSSTGVLQHMLRPLDDFKALLQTFVAKFELPDSRLGKFSKQLTWTLWNKLEATEFLKKFEVIKSRLNTWLTMGIWDTNQDHKQDHEAQERREEERRNEAEKQQILDWITPLNFFQRQADILAAWQPGTGKWLLSNAQFKSWESGGPQVLWCKGIPQTSQVYLVIDALDEYPEQQCWALLDQLSMLLGPTTRLMITSRPHVQFQDFFPDLVAVDIRATDEDILGYIDKQIRLAPRLSKHVQLQPKLRDEIKSRIASKVDGMFLLAKLHIGSLSTKNTIKAVHQALQFLPQTLDQTYEEAIERILSQSSDDKELALRTLTWVAYTKRPLAVAELQEALAIEPGSTSLDPDNLLDINIVLAVCAGLIIVDEEMSVNYFEEIQTKRFPDAHQMIALHCLAFWSFREAFNLTLASQFWERQTQAPRQLDLMPAIELLLRNVRSYREYYAGKWHLFDKHKTDAWNYGYGNWPAFPSLTWIAAAWNLLHIAVTMCGQLVGRGAQDALNVAAALGHEKIIEIILEKAPTMGWSIDFNEVLHFASARNQTSVVQLLLDYGIDMNASRGQYGTALQTVSFKNYVAVAQLLIDHGADVNASGPGQFATALQAASFMRNITVAQLLVDHGADVNAMGGEYGTALQAASHRGCMEIAQLLIDHGADVNAKAGVYGTALQAAAAWNTEITVAQLLLEHGADINAKGGLFGTALQAASYHCEIAVIQLLIDHGADVNAKAGKYGTALQAAATSLLDNIAVMQLLLDNGADVNAIGGYFGVALQGASFHGKIEPIQQLLDQGADVNVIGGCYGTALQAASWIGNMAVAQLLLDHGAGVNIKGGCCGTALHAASYKGHMTVAQLLIDHGADVNSQEATMALLYKLHLSITKILLLHFSWIMGLNLFHHLNGQDRSQDFFNDKVFMK